MRDRHAWDPSQIESLTLTKSTIREISPETLEEVIGGDSCGATDHCCDVGTATCGGSCVMTIGGCTLYSWVY